MIEKIKKLVSSKNFEDNRLALILIVENYSKEEIIKLRNENGDLTIFGRITSKEPCLIRVKEKGFGLYYCTSRYINTCFEGENGYSNLETYITRGDEDTLDWELKKEEKE